VLLHDVLSLKWWWQNDLLIIEVLVTETIDDQIIVDAQILAGKMISKSLLVLVRYSIAR